MPEKKKKPWGWSTSNKRNNFSLLPSSDAPSPPPSSSGHWMPPHWSPLRPWLPAGVPLTFNLWPTAPQNSYRAVGSVRSAGSTSCETLSCRQRGATLSTGVNSEYRCYRCSLRHIQSPFPWYSQHNITESLWLSLTFVCFRLRVTVPSVLMLLREDPAVPWWKAACYRQIQLQEHRAFILIEETCACAVQLCWQMKLFTFVWSADMISWQNSHLSKFIHSFIITNTKFSLWEYVKINDRLFVPFVIYASFLWIFILQISVVSLFNTQKDNYRLPGD